MSSSPLSLSSLSSSLPNAIPLLAHLNGNLVDLNPNTSQVNRTESVWESILGEDFQESSPHQAASFATYTQLATGADINARNYIDETPLHYAALRGNAEVVEILLARGATINAQSYTGNTPLHYAAQQGNAEVVEILLARGADINAQSYTGDTPLHYAAQQGNAEAIRILLAAGADINARNHSGNTPLYCSAVRK